jgi:hypothetical protein
MRRSMIARALTVLAVALSAACGSTQVGDAGEKVDQNKDLPAALVGSWSTAGTGTIRYHLTSRDFESIETISDVRPHTTVEIRVTQKGSATVDGDRLILTPIAATTSMHDPEHPADSYTDRPGETIPQTYIWNVNGPVLSLKNDAGLEITLKREP